VIFVTSYATKEFFVQAISSGAKDFIVKPVSPDILKEKIYGILGEEHERAVPQDLMEQVLADLKKTCKKGMETKAGMLIKEIQDKQFGPIAGARIAEICELITNSNYKTAMEKIKALDKAISPIPDIYV
jgi:FixJ family two-component response regulator